MQPQPFYQATITLEIARNDKNSSRDEWPKDIHDHIGPQLAGGAS